MKGDEDAIMRKRSGWFKFQMVQTIMMIAMTVFLLVRSYDGHGAYQTIEIKMISLGIWLLFCIGLLVMEWLIHWILCRK